MESNTPENNTTQTDAQPNSHPPVPSPVVTVEAEPIDSSVEPPIIEPERRLSALAWLAAIVVFLFNKKIGILFIVILLVMRKYPTINFKSMARRINPSRKSGGSKQ